MPQQTRRNRQRSIRVLLGAIFIVPLASLLGLWIFAATITVSSAIQEHDFNSQDQRYGSWAQTLFTQLAQERLVAYEWLSAGHRGPDPAYLHQQTLTNTAVKMLLDGLSSSPPGSPAARPALATFKAEISALAGIRTSVTLGKISALTSFNDYNSIVSAEFNLYSDLVVVNNTPLYMQAAASIEAGRALELASREATLAAGPLMSGGRMSQAERALFAQTAANRQYLMADAIRNLDPALGSGYRRADASPVYQSFTVFETAISNSVGSKGPTLAELAGFALASKVLFAEYQSAEVQDRLALSSLGTQIGNHLLWEVGLAGGIGLLAVVLSVLLMVAFGRRISRDLTGLQHAALDLAEERLPYMVDRLSRGEDVDVSAEAAPPAQGRILETARVAAAFSSVQRTAVEAAVGQARLREGVAQVFRNLAWRSQSLLHRQLTLLDGMERRSTEPETLEELFQLDHLTTRMRRHAEGLIILSGASPGRGWREPVPIMDVLRGAIAEVEDYKRVAVICESQDAVIGSAVADVIHMLAELIENATTYSPASTEVTIRAERVANGFAVEIEDRGIGIGADELAAFNERLANPPEFDLADSNQLGLFVVGRLAAKHHIRITLRMSPFGGTSAVVLLPHAIVALSDASGAFPPGVRVLGNGRELVSAGRELPGGGRDYGGNGRDLGGAGQDQGGNGRELGGSGRELGAGGRREVADTGPGLVGTGPGLIGTGPGLAGTGPGAAGAGPGLAGTGAGPGLAGAGPGLAGAGPGLAGAGPGAVGTGPGPVGTGPGLVGAGPELAGTGFGLTATGPGLAATGLGHDGPGLAVGGQGQPATGPEHSGPGLQPGPSLQGAGPWLEPAGGPDLPGGGLDLAGNRSGPGADVREPAGAGTEWQQGTPSAEPFDVFRINPPAGTGNAAGAGTPGQGNGRPESSVGADRESAWPDPPARRPPSGADSEKPWLPRRVRQASLAPQLKTDGPLIPESTQANASQPEEDPEPVGHGPNPADTRALVQSLQFGLDRARTSETPEGDSWSTPAETSWPPTPGESWSPPGSESWPSPAGNPELAGWPEEEGGQ
jgi:signal transduction histidine kinase